jgi:hypothetical protein
MPAHVVAAPPAASRPKSKTRPQPQAPRISWRGAGKPKVDGLFARSGKRAASTMPESRPARPMSAARTGRALRVSMAAGFRLPERAFPASRFAGPDVDGLPSPEAKRIVAAAPPETGVGNVLEIEIPASEMRIPPAPEANFERRFRWPGAMETKIPVCNAANGARLLAVPFGPPDEVKERS